MTSIKRATLIRTVRASAQAGFALLDVMTTTVELADAMFGIRRVEVSVD